MGLHRRLFQSSLSDKLRYNNIISINPCKQTLRFHHDNTTTKKPNKFLLQRSYVNNTDRGEKREHYFSVFSTDGQRISPEKNFYFRPPRDFQPPYPFAIIGNNNINDKHSNVFSDHVIFERPYRTRIIGSCDGLICIQDKKGNKKKCPMRANSVVLWNPSINDFRVIDYSSIVKRQPRYAHSSYFECIGFGFDPDSKEYKLLIQVENYYFDKSSNFEGIEYKFEVFSLKTSTWSPLRSPKVVPYISPWSSCVYIDGICYRWAYGNDDDARGDYILSFNFADEKFSYFPIPETGEAESYERYYLKLVDSEGLLGIFLHKMRGTDKGFHLWVRQKDESWSKVSQMCVRNVEQPLRYLEKDKLFFAREAGVLLFDPATNEVETLDINNDSSPEAVNMIPFVESSILPNGEAVCCM